MILAIDAGNSRLKWGVFDRAATLKADGAFNNTELSVDSPLPLAWRACHRAVISNVAGKPMAEIIHAMLCQLDLSMLWAASSVQSCDLINHYSQPKQLGTDRWAALIAAWQRYREPCLVINAGTALTIDSLGIQDATTGIFLGGLIIPGLKLMQLSLMHATVGISDIDGSKQDFPTNTADAVYTGALSAITGAIANSFSKLQLHEGWLPHCIIGGGDAVILAETLRHCDSANTIGMVNNLVIADNLVLEGLLLLERETR